MNIAIEDAALPSAVVKTTEIEPFTQKSFWELCQDSFSRSVPHTIGRVETKEGTHSYYDARQLCKFLFELVISKEGRAVRMKNTSNPIDDKPIKEIVFFEILLEHPSKAVFMGTQKIFLESSAFRSRIFNRNDPFDALSINFVFKDKIPTRIKKKTLIPLCITLFIVVFLISFCTFSVMKGKNELTNKAGTGRGPARAQALPRAHQSIPRGSE
ncbi:hypothetical protein NEDG_01407 [Nematocida displodere]|uniref:Uncharacterized protein n=1 Tax=Nematocida displodere TaxID=1805483 RepID=A0A177EBK4_9MICR|nr:hypothetical protein NEDG_01407 [Nematocida displodere]